MTHPDLTTVQSHVSDKHEYIDEQINDLHNALERAEAAVDKLRDTSKLQMTHRVQTMGAARQVERSQHHQHKAQ